MRKPGPQGHGRHLFDERVRERDRAREDQVVGVPGVLQLREFMRMTSEKLRGKSVQAPAGEVEDHPGSRGSLRETVPEAAGIGKRLVYLAERGGAGPGKAMLDVRSYPPFESLAHPAPGNRGIGVLQVDADHAHRRRRVNERVRDDASPPDEGVGAGGDGEPVEESLEDPLLELLESRSRFVDPAGTTVPLGDPPRRVAPRPGQLQALDDPLALEPQQFAQTVEGYLAGGHRRSLACSGDGPIGGTVKRRSPGRRARP